MTARLGRAGRRARRRGRRRRRPDPLVRRALVGRRARRGGDAVGPHRPAPRARRLGGRDGAGDGRRAVVVGCGLGADAEHLAGGLAHHRVRHLARGGRRGARPLPGLAGRLPRGDLLDLRRRPAWAPSTWWSRSTRSRRCTRRCASARSPAYAGWWRPAARPLVVQIVRGDDEAVTAEPPWTLTGPRWRPSRGTGRRRVAGRGAAAGPGQPAAGGWCSPAGDEALQQRDEPLAADGRRAWASSWVGDP